MQHCTQTLYDLLPQKSLLEYIDKCTMIIISRICALVVVVMKYNDVFPFQQRGHASVSYNVCICTFI